MDRVASLRFAARELRASIFRSLPWGVRLAHVWTVLSSVGIPFGQAVGAVFLMRGVEGMPDPGPKWNPNARKPADTLPRGYFGDWGKKVELTTLRKVRDADLVDDAMLTVMSKLLLKPETIREGVSVSEAQSFVLRGVMNAALDLVREQNRRREVSLFDVDDDDDRSGVIDLDDPRAAEKFEDLFKHLDLRRVKQDLARLLPWAPDYLDMLMEGYEDMEIIGDPSKGRESLLAKRLHLPNLTNLDGVPMSMGMWSKPNGYKDKIKKILGKHLR